MDSKFNLQFDPKKGHRALKRKKREIRVFVSSTFRDFKQEREQLIKKTFREVKKNSILEWAIYNNQYLCNIDYNIPAFFTKATDNIVHFVLPDVLCCLSEYTSNS